MESRLWSRFNITCLQKKWSTSLWRWDILKVLKDIQYHSKRVWGTLRSSKINFVSFRGSLLYQGETGRGLILWARYSKVALTKYVQTYNWKDYIFQLPIFVNWHLTVWVLVCFKSRISRPGTRKDYSILIQSRSNKVLWSALIKWSFFIETGLDRSGKNQKSWFFPWGLKYTLRTCFESKNVLSKSCPELRNQVHQFSKYRIWW